MKVMYYSELLSRYFETEDALKAEEAKFNKELAEKKAKEAKEKAELNAAKTAYEQAYKEYVQLEKKTKEAKEKANKLYETYAKHLSVEDVLSGFDKLISQFFD